MRRVRTTKNLAQRIDLQYFTRPHPFRSWRFWLCLAVPIIAMGWLVTQRATGEKVYSSGPLSSSHAVFGRNCGTCHVKQAGVFRKEVSDTACLACHDAPAHHADKVKFTPACGSCHVEHKGSVRLASTADSSCTQCHSDLRPRTGNAQFFTNITGLDNGHPEFAVKRPGASDPGQIRLNHYAHLQPKLAGPHGPVQMQCRDCHRAAGTIGSWPYSSAQVITASAVVGETPAEPNIAPRAYMYPIRYADHCAGCHTKDLQFDARFADAVPHDKPDIVQEFIARKYSDYFASHPNALSERISADRQIAGKFNAPLPAPQNRQEWINVQLMIADRIVFEKGCKLCHTLTGGKGPLPGIAPSAIPVRWLPHASFDHDTHRMLTCTSCHAKATENKLSSEVLIPDLATCRSCHQQGGAQKDAASGNCSECHQYHNWDQEHPTNGKYTIKQLRAAR